VKKEAEPPVKQGIYVIIRVLYDAGKILLNKSGKSLALPPELGYTSPCAKKFPSAEAKMSEIAAVLQAVQTGG